jgi:uncharacterized protein YjbJ (UPF0337 family)
MTPELLAENLGSDLALCIYVTCIQPKWFRHLRCPTTPVTVLKGSMANRNPYPDHPRWPTIGAQNAQICALAPTHFLTCLTALATGRYAALQLAVGERTQTEAAVARSRRLFADPAGTLPDRRGALGLRFFDCSCSGYFSRNLGLAMVRGEVNKVKGAVEEAVGKVTGSKKLQTEGKAKGTVQNAAGDAKDRARSATR